MNASPNAWYCGDTAHIYSGPGSHPIPVRVIGFTRSLVKIELPDRSHRLRPYDALQRK